MPFQARIDRRHAPRVVDFYYELTYIPISASGDYYFIEKANVIKYLYALLDRHPRVNAVVSKPTGMVPSWLAGF